MSSNKSAKNRLIELYGAECFIEKLHLRPGGYKEKYKSKGQYKMKQLTFHHILEKRNRRTSNSREWCSIKRRKSRVV